MLEDMTAAKATQSQSIAEILESLDDKDREILLNAADDPRLGRLTLAKALKDRGLKISDTAIQRYRQANDLAR
jgi:hypothetical protein